ncbi:hypothetical protein HYT84_00405 [Candidatus Micrarchaeota archaeon]|nr:hypothetical protein [Candidatus Micrarchaeota archaeon]
MGRNKAVPVKVFDFPPELELSSALFKKLILPIISNLPKNATQEMKEEALFNLLKIGGSLKIKYEISENGDFRTPNLVLQKKTADCDELALTFVAAARKLGWDTSRYKLISLQFFLNPGIEEKASHMILFRETDKTVFDFTEPNSEKERRKITGITQDQFSYFIKTHIPGLGKIDDFARAPEVRDQKRWGATVIYYNQVDQLIKNQNYKKAVLYLKKYLEFAPDDEGAKKVLSFVLTKQAVLDVESKNLKSLQNTVTLFQEALLLDPRNDNAKYNLSVAFIKIADNLAHAKNYGEAAEFYEKAYEQNKTNVPFLMNLSFVYNNMGILAPINPSKASDLFKKALRYTKEAEKACQGKCPELQELRENINTFQKNIDIVTAQMKKINVLDH